MGTGNKTLPTVWAREIILRVLVFLEGIMKNVVSTLRLSICAGLLIAIGGSVFLSCENRYIGAMLFSVALLCICYRGYYLYTGKIGYAVTEHKKSDIVSLAVGLVGNLFTAYFLGLVLSFMIPALKTAAVSLCAAKLAMTIPSVFIRALFCGVLMYLAVSIFREKKSVLGIVFCVPVFILSGFEHSIADTFYFGAAGVFGWRFLLFTAAAVAGNSLGAMILPLLDPSHMASDPDGGVK